MSGGIGPIGNTPVGLPAVSQGSPSAPIQLDTSDSSQDNDGDASSAPCLVVMGGGRGSSSKLGLSHRSHAGGLADSHASSGPPPQPLTRSRAS